MKTAGFASFFFSGDNTAFAAERAVLEHLRIHAAQNPIATWIVIACLFLMILLFVVLFFMIRLQIRMRKNFIENQATAELLDHILKQTGFDFFQISLDNRRLDVLKRHNIVWQYDKSGVALPPERCVLPEDAPHFREQWDALKSGKVAAIQLDYGMLAGEAVRHFFLYGEKKYSKVFKQDIIVGYVRETTTDKQKERRLSELDAFTQAILSVSPCIMWVKDPANEFRIAETNHAFEKFLKLPKDKLLGHGEWEFFTQSEYVRIHQQDLQSLNRDGISECVDSWTDAEGNKRICRFYRMKYYSAGDSTQLICAVTDLTRETELQANTENSKKYLEAIFALQPCIVTLKDIADDFRYYDCNEAMCQMTGLCKENIISKRFRDIFSSTDFFAQRLLDVEASKSTSVHESVAEYTDGAGTRRHGRTLRRKLVLGGRDLLLTILLDQTE